MINKNIINTLLKAATTESKNAIIKELLNHISLGYDYNDIKAGHILEMLCDCDTVISVKDINVDYINKNLNLIMYNHEKYNIKNICVMDVDNIDCIVKIRFDYLEKINEDRDDVSYSNGQTNISFIDCPGILLKKS